MPGDVPDPASWVAGATKSELERLLIFLGESDRGTYETDVAARKPRAEYTRGLTIVGEAWDYMGNLTEVVYSISFVY